MKILYKNRSAKINLVDVGKSFKIHNGKDHVKLKIQSKMINHRFGEFVKTRKIINKRTK